ncbi:hypothetical protein [Thalassotalea sp. G2M2-11]|uniref:hypothetical protein n=1 Tax=Thalassotalea sp. G2M2-11 TaxID=2787627 RepID=UPI0019D21AC4|nr:hypothetical protein [Thalassotalea sp. G2M2-11]
MKHRLSFAYYNILSDNIVEVVADEGVEVSLEMLEEGHDFINRHIDSDFGLLINRVNNYSYSYEAKLSVASYERLKAIGFVYYSEISKEMIENLSQIRAFDRWNYRVFSGLELGWQQAYQWLEQQLIAQQVD